MDDHHIWDSFDGISGMEINVEGKQQLTDEPHRSGRC